MQVEQVQHIIEEHRNCKGELTTTLYCAAIFYSTHSGCHEGYAEDTDTILELARNHPGFLSMEATGDVDLSIAVSSLYRVFWKLKKRE